MISRTCLSAALLTCALWAMPGSAQDEQSASAPGRLQVLHNAADLASERLDVYVNGLLLPGADGLAFRTGTPFAPVAAGTAVTVVVMADSPASDTLAVASYVAESGVDRRVLIEGGRGTLVARVSQTRASIFLGAGEPRAIVSVYNGSADVTSFGYDAYSAADGSGFAGLTSVAGELPAHFSFPAGQYVIRTRLPDLPERAYGANDFRVLAGQTGLFFASGSRTSATAPFGLFVLTDDGAVVSLPLGAVVASEPAPASRVRIEAWPNPARSYISMAVRGRDAAAQTQVDAVDLQGRQMWASPGALRPDGQLRIDVSAWPAGRYVVRVLGPLGLLGQAPVTVVH